MNEAVHRRLNTDLAFEFHLFTLEHPEWVAGNVPAGAAVVMQTDDADFNAWARTNMERSVSAEPARPMVLVHIREMRPVQSRIVRAEAELITG
jgi:hypothetical protein